MELVLLATLTYRGAFGSLGPRSLTLTSLTRLIHSRKVNFSFIPQLAFISLRSFALFSLPSINPIPWNESNWTIHFIGVGWRGPSLSFAFITCFLPFACLSSFSLLCGALAGSPAHNPQKRRRPSERKKTIHSSPQHSNSTLCPHKRKRQRERVGLWNGWVNCLASLFTHNSIINSWIVHSQYAWAAEGRSKWKQTILPILKRRIDLFSCCWWPAAYLCFINSLQSSINQVLVWFRLTSVSSASIYLLL